MTFDAVAETWRWSSSGGKEDRSRTAEVQHSAKLELLSSANQPTSHGRVSRTCAEILPVYDSMHAERQPREALQDAKSLRITCK